MVTNFLYLNTNEKLSVSRETCGATSYGSGWRKEICGVTSYGSGWRKETYGVTSYGGGWRKETYGVTSYGGGWRKETYGVTNYGSGWRKDVVNYCLDFGSMRTQYESYSKTNFFVSCSKQD